MTEILTESFCERCGTRYTFESSAPRRSRVGRVRTLSKGLRNFVLSDDASLSEAMADARSEEELSATAHQLDAFHKTFNFCLTCRQYTCSTCWNPTEGRCLTCAPMPGTEVGGEIAHEMPAGSDGHAHAEMDEAWPEADLERIQAVLGHPAAPESLDSAVVPAPAEAAPAEAAPAKTIEPVGEPAAEDLVAAAEVEAGGPGGVRSFDTELIAPEPPAIAAGEELTLTAGEDIAGSPSTADHIEQTDEDWTAATTAAAGVAGSELIGVAPGQSLEDAIAAYESRLAEQELADAVTAAPDTHEMVAGDEADLTAPQAEATAAQAEMARAPDGETSPAAEAMEPTAAAAAPDETVLETPADQPARHDPAAAQGAGRADAADAVPAAPDGPVAPPPAPTPTDVIAQPTWPAAPAGQPTSDGVPQPTPPAPTPPATTPTAPPPAAAGETTTSPPATWLRVAPDNDGTPAPQWPAKPAWPAASGREMPTTLAGRPLLPRDDASALWAASAREVLGSAPAGAPAAAATASPQPCVQCGLSLSANARFCRRCGSRQG